VYDSSTARHRAARLALGGNALALPDRPESPAAIHAEIARLGDTPELWSPPAQPFLPGAADAAVLQSPNLVLAYSIAANSALFIASVAVPATRLTVRQVADWSPYGVDATREFVPELPDWP
jgi:hypothetical protein